MSSNCVTKGEHVFDTLPWIIDVPRKGGSVCLTADPREGDNVYIKLEDGSVYIRSTPDGLYWARYGSSGMATFISPVVKGACDVAHSMLSGMSHPLPTAPYQLSPTENLTLTLFNELRQLAADKDYESLMSLDYSSDGTIRAAGTNAYVFFPSIGSSLRIIFRVENNQVFVESLGMDDGIPLNHPVPYVLTTGWFTRLEEELKSKLALAEVKACLGDSLMTCHAHSSDAGRSYIEHTITEVGDSYIRVDEPSSDGHIPVTLGKYDWKNVTVTMDGPQEAPLMVEAINSVFGLVPPWVFQRHWRDLPDVFFLAYQVPVVGRTVRIGANTCPYLRLADDEKGRLDIYKVPGRKRILALHWLSTEKQTAPWLVSIPLKSYLHAGFVVSTLRESPHDELLAKKLAEGYVADLPTDFMPDTEDGYLHGCFPKDYMIDYAFDIPSMDSESAPEDYLPGKPEKLCSMTDEEILEYLEKTGYPSLAERQVHLDVWKEMRESGLSDPHIKLYFKENSDLVKRTYAEMTASPYTDLKEDVRKAVQGMKEMNTNWTEVADILARTLAEVYNDDDSIEAMKQIVPNVDCVLTPAIVQNLSNAAKDAKEDIDLSPRDEETPETPIEGKPTAITLRDFIQGMYDSGVSATKAVEEVSESLFSIYNIGISVVSPYAQAWGVAEHSPKDDDRALWTGTYSVDSVQGVVKPCEAADASAPDDAYDNHDDDPPKSEPEDDETEDEIDPCEEFEEIIRCYGSRFEGQPIRKVVFDHFRLSPDEFRSTAEWKDTPCPMSLKVEAVYTLTGEGIFIKKWSAESVFGGRTYRATTETLDKLIDEYNDTYNHLVK